MVVALDYCHTVNSNIELFLKDKMKTMVFNIENADRDFPVFWKLIGAEGDMKAAMAEFNNNYNTRKAPPIREKKNIVFRLILKGKRLIVKFPRFFRDA